MGVATMLDDGRVLAVGRLDATKAGRHEGWPQGAGNRRDIRPVKLKRGRRISIVLSMVSLN